MQRSATAIGKRISSAHTASFNLPASLQNGDAFFYLEYPQLSRNTFYGIAGRPVWKGAVCLEKRVIITLRGKNISGIARLELRDHAFRAVFNLRPPQSGNITAFLLCPDRIVKARLTGTQCRLDEQLPVEGILLAKDTPDGPVFFAEGGALHSHINFSRIREELRFRWLSANMPGGKTAPSTSEAALETVSSEHPLPQESSARVEPVSANAADTHDRLPAAVPVESAEEGVPFPPPRSDAAKNILHQARGLYPANHPQAAVSAPGRGSPPVESGHPYESGFLQKNSWTEEVHDMLLSHPSTQDGTVNPTVPARQTRPPASGLRRAEPVFNPFPDAFPRSCWKKVIFPGAGRYYLEGDVLKGNARFLVHALPGEYSPTPQAEYRDFTKFLRAADGKGYWLRIRRKPPR